MATYTPVQLAHLLGYTDEARPGKVVRDYLRGKHPEHKNHQRWELDDDQAIDVIANVPRRTEVRPVMHPWLEVPWDRIQPIGALAVAAGRIEAAATVTLRALLRPLDRGTSNVISSTPSFSATTRLIRSILKESAILEADETLLSDWISWEGQADAFMKKRNSLLHGAWGQSVEATGEFRVFSFSRGNHAPAPSAEDILQDAAQGIQIAKDGYFANRIAMAIASDSYQSKVVSRGDIDGWFIL